MFKDKVLMITGGTGSFGQAVVERFLPTKVREIRIFSRDELKQETMRLSFNNDKLKFYIGDIREYDSIFQALKGVDYVFHAAALKQVPSCEFYPMEAVRTNILGAENIMSAAIAAGVNRVIVLSTDKAVYPINAMGMSKAMMEKLMVAKARMQQDSKTVFCATRYGNVMTSRGSVIPLFISQLVEGKSITITDPNMTRFLMSLEDSVELVLHAFQHGKQGDIFVQKAPASTIADLAQALKEIFSKGSSSTIIGSRHGEKLYETLLTREEVSRAEDIGKFYRVPADNRELNYARLTSEVKNKINNADDYTSHNTERLNIEDLKSMLLKLPYVKNKISQII